MKFLAIGNPFGDRFAEVSDEFLEESGLPKNTTTVTNIRDSVEKTWEHSGGKGEISLGGSSVNVLKVLSSLGNHKLTLIGKIGSDTLGEDLTKRLSELGVETVLSKGLKSTGLVNCFITPDKERTMHAYLGAAFELSDQDILESASVFNRVDHVHMEGYLAYYGEVLEESIFLANKARVRTSLDLSSAIITKDPLLQVKLRGLIREVDIIFGNVQEFLGLSPDDFCEEQTLVITNGGKSCFVKEPEGHVLEIKLPPVETVVDTTGAGDFFIAGFLDSLGRGESVETCVRRGHELAGRVIGRMGTNL